jgi:hypothetical protein
MTTPHKATPEQWAWQEEWAREPHADQDSSCILELRDRIKFLEATQHAHIEAKPQSPAPAGGLMQAVGAAICTIADCGDTPSNWAPEARAAIHAVAAWFDAIGYGATAGILRQEVERHG